MTSHKPQNTQRNLGWLPIVIVGVVLAMLGVGLLGYAIGNQQDSSAPPIEQPTTTAVEVPTPTTTPPTAETTTPLPPPTSVAYPFPYERPETTTTAAPAAEKATG